MTAMNDDAFGVVTLTPDRMLDLSTPEARVSFDVSTKRSGGYDWIEIVLTPFEDNLVHPADDIWQIAGAPENSIRISMTPGTDNKFTMSVDRDDITQRYVRCGEQCEGADWWTTYGSATLPLIPDARRRETFELTITDDDRISFGVVDYFDGINNDQSFYWLDNVDVSPLDWKSAVVQIQHFSFNPTNNCGNASCDGDTWHWDNIKIDPAIPFSMVPSEGRYLDPQLDTGNEMKFETSSGDDAFVRFSAIGTNMEISVDGGATWELAELQREAEDTPDLYGRFRNYFHPIPARVDAVQIRGESWWGGAWHARDFSIWSENIGGTPPVDPPIDPPVDPPIEDINVLAFERGGAFDELDTLTIRFDGDASSQLDLQLSQGGNAIDVGLISPEWNSQLQQATWDLSSLRLPAGYYAASIEGPTLAAASETILVAYRGDANLDGSVDATDFLAMVNGYGEPNPVWTDGDFDGTGDISFLDFIALVENFGKTAV